MKVALAGQGAFGVKHLEAIARIEGVEVVSWQEVMQSRPRK